MKKVLFLGALLVLLAGCNQRIVVEKSNLPIIKIDTRGEVIPDEPKIPAHMGIIDNGGDNSVNAAFNGYDGAIGIERRGTSSQFFAKKQYGLETLDEAGEEIDVELLGLPEESDWILYSSYSDKSLMRNNLVYQTATELGYYASRQMFVELFLNDEYQGVYVLLERIKRDKNRVDISKVKDGEITGGYLLEFQCGVGPDSDEVFFQTSYYAKNNPSCVYIIQYPNDEDLTPERKAYISDYLERFEAALFGETFTDPAQGYAPFINTENFIDYLLVNELFKNPDVLNRSVYMYKDAEGKLELGPVWDFDIALGNFDEGGTPEGFLLTNKPWSARLFSDPIFLAAYKERYKTLRQTTFSNATLNSKIDAMVSVLGKAADRNFQRWPILGTYIWPNRFVGDTYESEIAYLKEWLGTRLAWLDANMETLQ
jgi:spore coat protein CotH